MSRSYRRNIPGTKCVRSTFGCVSDGTMHKWKKSYNRDLRRKARHLIKKLDLESDYIDDAYWPSDPETDSYVGNNWWGPHDGWCMRDEESFDAPWQMNMK